MDALLLAAGYGTRLQPLTLSTPKALVKVGGRSMIDYALHQLLMAGVTRFVINIHHFGEQIIDYLTQYGPKETEIWISDERDFLCDTGGGIKKAMEGRGVYRLSAYNPSTKKFDSGHSTINDLPLQKDSFCVYNVDVLSNIPILPLQEFHLSRQNLVTLSVKHRPTSRSFLINRESELCGWRNNGTGEEIISRPGQPLFPIAYSCIQFISPEILPLITEQGAFSITHTYLRLSEKIRIATVCEDTGYWMDMGRIEHLDEINQFIQNEPSLRF